MGNWCTDVVQHLYRKTSCYTGQQHRITKVICNYDLNPVSYLALMQLLRLQKEMKAYRLVYLTLNKSGLMMLSWK